MAYTPLKDRNAIASLKRTMDSAWWGMDVSGRAQAPDVLNGEYLIGVNAAGTGTVNLIGVDANNNVVTASGAPLTALVVPLTAAQLIAMFTTPVSIIAAPATGKAIVVREIVFEMITTATVFTGGGVVSFVYHGTSVPVHAGTVPAATVNAVAGTSATQLGMAVAANGTVVSAATGVDITNATGAFAAGTGTAKVHLWYHVITL